MEQLYCKPCPDLPLAGDETQTVLPPHIRENFMRKKSKRHDRETKWMDFLCFCMSYLLWKLFHYSIHQDTTSTNMRLGLLSLLHKASGWTAELSPQKAFSSPVIGKGLQYSLQSSLSLSPAGATAPVPRTASQVVPIPVQLLQVTWNHGGESAGRSGVNQFPWLTPCVKLPSLLRRGIPTYLGRWCT